MEEQCDQPHRRGRGEDVFGKQNAADGTLQQGRREGRLRPLAVRLCRVIEGDGQAKRLLAALQV